MNNRQGVSSQAGEHTPLSFPPQIIFGKLSSIMGDACLKLCVGLALMLGWQWQSCAAGKTWVGGAAGAANDWNTVANWNPAGVPGTGDDVTVPKNATAFPMLAVAAANGIKSLTINAGAALTISSGGSLVTLAGAASVKVDGTLTISGGTLSAHQDITGSGSTTMSGGTLKVGHDWHLDPSQFSATGGTVEWTGEVGNAGPGGFPGGSGAYQFFNVLIDASVDPGMDNQANSFVITGNWTNNGTGTLTHKVTRVTFGGTSPQVIAGSAVTAFNNLTINNANGVTLTVTASATGTVTLTQGVVATGANALSLTSSAVVSGASAAAYVNGNVSKAFATGNNQSFSFPVGDAATFAPVSLASLNISTAGSVTARTTPGQHPAILSAGINPYRDAMRYWTLTNSPAGIVVSTCNATFNFAARDLCSGAVATSFIAKRYASGWFSNTTSSAIATSTSVSGLKSFGDFALGQTGTGGGPVMTYCRVQADRSTLVGLAGVSGATYTMQASVDLANWTNIGTTSAGTNGSCEFRDTGTAGLPVRFYRASYP